MFVLGRTVAGIAGDENDFFLGGAQWQCQRRDDERQSPNQAEKSRWQKNGGRKIFQGEKILNVSALLLVINQDQADAIGGGKRLRPIFSELGIAQTQSIAAQLINAGQRFASVRSGIAMDVDARRTRRRIQRKRTGYLRARVEQFKLLSLDGDVNRLDQFFGDG